MTMCGRRRSTTGTTARPSSTSPTTSKSRSASRRHLIASRTTFWSSARTIRIEPVPGLRLSSRAFFTISVTSTSQPPKGAARTSRECSVRGRYVYSYTYLLQGRDQVSFDEPLRRKRRFFSESHDRTVDGTGTYVWHALRSQLGQPNMANPGKARSRRSTTGVPGGAAGPPIHVLVVE